MAKENFRYINTKFWDDNYVVNLDPSEKLLFLYFLTNPLTNLCGIYEINYRRIAFDTGFDKDMIIKIFERFTKDNKIFYFNGWVFIKNFPKNQRYKGEKLEIAIKKEMENIPKEIMAKINKINTLLIGYQYPMTKIKIKNKDKDKDKDIYTAPKVAEPKISKLLVNCLLKEYKLERPDKRYLEDNIYPARALAKKITVVLNKDGNKNPTDDDIVEAFSVLLKRMDDFNKENATNIRYIDKYFNVILNKLK